MRTDRTTGRWGDRRRIRIGLLGGSFNPAHDGHRHVALHALRALRLDQVWLLVSPGNPLKPRAGMAPFAERLASAQKIGDGVRLLASDIEAAIGQRYSARTLQRLQQLFPRARFVWIIGADNLWQLPRWRDWRRLAARTAIAVLPRPGWTRRALHGAAASRLRRYRRDPGALLQDGAPAWALVPAPEHPASATALRQAAAAAAAPVAPEQLRRAGLQPG
ncbi:nicotinic acid mononucleotide adenylyltransferase [Pseudoroseomonas deserti]|uniref:Probable nicotinate-nucleotide adenylyltransferase n=1 Tax=Teichococcus deserti TaxID=1817963 RepID=A0A1V2GUK9_9PROT|nr:nicotinate-nucleotide adenylyltransferase [Pseudoroseomonas deserti]ONG44582.1 nicotinic acid mononucleotide adenylyltransferase [Pseudoroseomonas deserti]